MPPIPAYVHGPVNASPVNVRIMTTGPSGVSQVTVIFWPSTTTLRTGTGSVALVVSTPVCPPPSTVRISIPPVTS